MRMILKDVLDFKYVDLKIDGITLVSGENNTGKSFISKMLYTLLTIPYHEYSSLSDALYNVSVSDELYGAFSFTFFENSNGVDGHIILNHVDDRVRLATCPMRVISAPTSPISTKVLYFDSAELLDHEPVDASARIYRMYKMYEDAHSSCNIHGYGLFSKISDVFDYHMFRRDGRWCLYKTDISHAILMSQMSPAIKIFAMLRFAVEWGIVGTGDVIILDNIDSYMHPKWQLVLAEVVARLQESIGIKFLITTHSPYLIEAIELYSKVREVEDSCRYYLSHNNEDGKSVSDVTDNIEKLFKPLAEPLQVLENVRYS